MAFCGRALDLLVDIDGGDCAEDLCDYESDLSDQEVEEDEPSPIVKNSTNNKPRYFLKPCVTISSSKECSICLDDDTEFVDLSCKHRFCKDCVVNYLTTKINDSDSPYQHEVSSLTRDGQALVLDINTHVGIVCPHIQCRGIIQFLEVKSFVDEVTYSRFDRSVLNEILYGMPDIRPCPFGCGNFLQEDCLCGTEECREKELLRRRVAAKKNRTNKQT